MRAASAAAAAAELWRQNDVNGRRGARQSLVLIDRQGVQGKGQDRGGGPDRADGHLPWLGQTDRGACWERMDWGRRTGRTVMMCDGKGVTWRDECDVTARRILIVIAIFRYLSIINIVTLFIRKIIYNSRQPGNLYKHDRLSFASQITASKFDRHFLKFFKRSNLTLGQAGDPRNPGSAAAKTCRELTFTRTAHRVDCAHVFQLA